MWRPWYGRALTIVIAAICAVTVVVVAWKEGAAEALAFAPWLALMTLACWASFWRPCVEVSAGGVRLVNVTRTVDVPWPAIQMIETKWALTLVTAVGTFTSWAAPAPGARAAARSMPSSDQAALHQRSLPRWRPPAAATAATHGVRPGDLPDTPSGAAATKIRARWEQLRAEGHLDDPRLERTAATVHWHTGTLVAAAGLLLLAVIATIVS